MEGIYENAVIDSFQENINDSLQEEFQPALEDETTEAEEQPRQLYTICEVKTFVEFLFPNSLPLNLLKE